MVTDALQADQKNLRLVTEVRQIPRGYVLVHVIRCHDGTLVPVFARATIQKRYQRYRELVNEYHDQRGG